MSTHDRRSATDSDLYFTHQCPFCSGTQMGIVAMASWQAGEPDTKWLRCVQCLRGVVLNDSRPAPGTRPLDTPDYVPEDAARTWNEVRDCLSVGAYTATVMLCRKILFHVAVDEGLPEKGDNGRAPTFAAALAYLEAEGVLTRKMRPWVTRVKDVGNEANHEIAGHDENEALTIAKFTREILYLAYTLPAESAEDVAP